MCEIGYDEDDEEIEKLNGLDCEDGKIYQFNEEKVRVFIQRIDFLNSLFSNQAGLCFFFIYKS